jgi:phasin family protein
MTSLPEQFSAARLTQLDNGFNLIQSFSDQALDRASRVIALQFQASRAAIEQSSDALRQLLAVRDPRDLLALGAQSQQNLRTMFNYGSELFSVAAGAGSAPLRSYSVDALNAITTANAAAAQQTVDAAVASLTPASPAAPAPEAAPAQEAAPAPESEADQAAAAISIVTSDVEPGVEPTAIAKATSEALDIPVAPPHPVAASVPIEVSVEIELPKIDPLEAMPPVVPGTTKVTEIRGNKGRRKPT